MNNFNEARQFVRELAEKAKHQYLREDAEALTDAPDEEIVRFLHRVAASYYKPAAGRPLSFRGGDESGGLVEVSPRAVQAPGVVATVVTVASGRPSGNGFEGPFVPV